MIKIWYSVYKYCLILYLSIVNAIQFKGVLLNSSSIFDVFILEMDYPNLRLVLKSALKTGVGLSLNLHQGAACLFFWERSVYWSFMVLWVPELCTSEHYVQLNFKFINQLNFNLVLYLSGIMVMSYLLFLNIFN